MLSIRSLGPSRLAMAGALLAGALIAGCSPQGKGGGSRAAQLTPRQACLATLDPALGEESCRQAVTDNGADTAARNRLALLRLKRGELKAARQGFQVAYSQDKDADAQFGLGLALEAIGEAGGNTPKFEAARRDPMVIDRYRKYGVAEPDLMTFETAPEILGGPTFARTKALTPNMPLASSLGVDVQCLVAADSRLHDCKLLTPLAPAQAPFGEAAKTIVALSRVKPAKTDGKVVPDAPVLLTMVYGPMP